MIAKGMMIIETVQRDRLEDFICLANKNGWYVSRKTFEKTNEIGLQLVYVGHRINDYSSNTPTKFSCGIPAASQGSRSGKVAGSILSKDCSNSED